jgi:hypothetical protein
LCWGIRVMGDCIFVVYLSIVAVAESLRVNGGGL